MGSQFRDKVLKYQVNAENKLRNNWRRYSLALWGIFVGQCCSLKSLHSMSLGRLSFLQRALWSPRNPFCGNYDVPDSQVCAGTVGIPCAATPCVGAGVSLLTLRRRQQSHWNHHQPSFRDAHIAVPSELTFCQGRLWICSLQKHWLGDCFFSFWGFCLFVFAFALQDTPNFFCL